MRMLIKFFLLFILMMPFGALTAEKGLIIKSVRFSSYSTFTRVVFEIEAATPYVLNKTADGKSLLFTAYNLPLVVQAQLPVIRDGVVSGLEVSQDAGQKLIIVRLDTAAGEVKDFVLRSPDRIVLDIMRGTVAVPSAPEGKLITVTLDPGHGGRDTGIVTAQGMEKAFTLSMALTVKKILQKNPRIKVVLTREKDQLLSLDERAAASNAAEATVFVSIHASAGAITQVYVQDLSDESFVQATRPGSGDFIGFEAGSAEQQMLWGRQQATHVQESGVLGRRLARQFAEKSSAEPVQAPLAGLKPVDAAAVLVECSLTKDGSKIAEAIAEGIEYYVRQNQYGD
jgi:N-acetylmuramoyl-L-alanine amidase